MFILLPAVQAYTVIEMGETNPPQNLVLLILDGTGSRYVCPGYYPQALDGSIIKHAEIPVLEKIISEGFLVPEVNVPTPKTGPAHSVIVTGYSGAEQEMVAYHDATIYDILEMEGFVSLGLMHKGDFEQLRNEQDVVLYSETNSVNEPSLKIQVNDNRVPADIIHELEYWEQKLPSYLEGTQGIERYTAYSDWEFDTANDIISLMARKHQDIRYVFTINIGVVDSAGHYRGPDGYIDSIEGIDSKLEPLHASVNQTNTALVITGDHGMAFKSVYAPRGGHASKEYYSDEAVTVPLIIYSTNAVTGMWEEQVGQEDIAPTLLSILDIPEVPKYADGEILPVKSYANLRVSSNTQADVEIFQGENKITSGTGDSLYIFTGLKPKINYIVKVSNGNDLLEQAVHLDGDSLVKFRSAANDEMARNKEIWRKGVASVMIFLVIIVGLWIISRIGD